MVTWTDISGTDTDQLIRWIYLLRKEQFGSFVELAVREPHAWERLREAPEMRRQIAMILGWPRVCDSALVEQRRVLDIAAVLLNRGYTSAVEVWFELPIKCHRLHFRGDLDPLFALLGLDEWAATMPKLLPDLLESAEEYRTLNAWLQLDPQGVRDACEEGWHPEVGALLPLQPQEGWITRGGRVFTVASLVVARYLEANDIPFVAPNMNDLPHDPQQLAAGFSLPKHDAVILISPTSPGSDQGVLQDSPVRVLWVDTSLLRTSLHVVAFALHLRFLLADADIVTKRRLIGVSDLLSPDPKTDGSSQGTKS